MGVGGFGDIDIMKEYEASKVEIEQSSDNNVPSSSSEEEEEEQKSTGSKCVGRLNLVESKVSEGLTHNGKQIILIVWQKQ